MQLHDDGTLVVSATDLVGFLECDHLVTLEELRARGELEKPIRDDPELELVRRRGYEHEALYIEALREQGRTVVEMTLREPRTPAELRDAEAETLAAMRAGTDVIFQGTFFDGRWRGHPDFLLRRDDRPSDLGPWSYDVADTKLAKRVKAAAILQMCVYADQLARLQGIPPETISVVTGDRLAHPHRLDDYAAYYRSAKRRFEERVFETAAGDAPATYPEPVDHCRVCSWWIHCVDRRRADDHLSLVAGAARTQRRALTGAGVTTLAGLAALPEDRAVRDVRPQDPRPAAPPGHPPAPRPRGGPNPVRAHPAQPGRARQGPVRAAAALGARRVLRHRGGPMGARRRPRVPVRLGGARPGRRARVPRAVGARPGAGEADARGVRRPRAGAPRARSRDARLPLRRVRVGRPQAADAAPRDPRGRDRRPAPRPCPRQPLRPRRAAGHPGGRRELLDQEARDVLHAPARGRDHAGRLLGRRVRALDGRAGSRRSSTPSPPTTATTASRTCSSATGSRAGATRRSRRTPSGTPTASCPAPAGRTARPRAEGRRGPGRDAGTRGCAPRRRARGPARAHGRAAGPLAARGAARLAPPRGEAPVVGPLPARGGADRRPRGGRVRARGAAVRRRPGPDRQVRAPPLPVRPRAGRQDRRGQVVPRPCAQRRGLGLGHVDGRRSSTLDPVNGTISLKRNAGNRHPVALIPTKPFGTEPMRGALGRLADHVAAHGHRGPGPLPGGTRPAAAAAAADRGAGGGRRARSGRRRHDARRARRSGCGSTRRCSRSRGRPAPARRTPPRG